MGALLTEGLASPVCPRAKPIFGDLLPKITERVWPARVAETIVAPLPKCPRLPRQ